MRSSKALIRRHRPSWCGTREAERVITMLDGALPPLLPVYRCKLLDGNCIRASEHRIKELRELRAGALPGKSLVVLDPSLRLPIDVFPCEDGHAQERSLLSQVLLTVEALDLWIADRNFRTLGFLSGIIQAGAYFAIREHKGLPWQPVEGTALQSAGKTDTGRVFWQPIEITDQNGDLHRLRRIEVRLNKPTRDGETTIAIVTNLPEGAEEAEEKTDRRQSHAPCVNGSDYCAPALVLEQA
jgi:hypothetical protein